MANVYSLPLAPCPPSMWSFLSISQLAVFIEIIESNTPFLVFNGYLSRCFIFPCSLFILIFKPFAHVVNAALLRKFSFLLSCFPPTSCIELHIPTVSYCPARKKPKMRLRLSAFLVSSKQGGPPFVTWFFQVAAMFLSSTVS